VGGRCRRLPTGCTGRIGIGVALRGGNLGQASAGSPIRSRAARQQPDLVGDGDQIVGPKFLWGGKIQE